MEIYRKIYIKSKADFRKLFDELINAGRDMALRDSLENVYLSEDMYFKDVCSRYLQSNLITDADIEAWAAGADELSEFEMSLLIVGAKAFRDNEIKHIEK